jgi:hypothetical protein
MRQFLVLVVVIFVAGCSSGGTAAPQGRAVPYGQDGGYAAAPAAPTYPGTRPPPPPPAGVGSRAPVYSPAAAPRRTPSASGPFRWHTTLAAAQAEARAHGKLILAEASHPGCGLCEKFKTRTVPANEALASSVAVGYFFDLTAPEDRRVASLLRANLKKADLMPLVGFLTPDLQWVHGFWGQDAVSNFPAQVAVARGSVRARPIAAAEPAPPPVPAEGATLVAFVNEYGEPEWGPADEVVPVDALSGTDAAAAAALALASPAAPPPVSHPTPEPAPVLATAPALPTVGELLPEPTAPPVVAEAAPAAEPAAAAPEDEEVRAWGEHALRYAYDQIRSGDLDGARTTLATVVARLPESDLGREASKGRVAVYNWRRLQATPEGEQAAVREQARRDLGATRWETLFS